MQRILMAGDEVHAIGSDVVRVATATGVLAILAVAALVLLFTAGQPFGTANDYLNAVIGVISAFLAILVSRAFGGSPMLPALAVVGAGVTVLGSWMVISGTTGFQFAGFVSAVGFALIGAWLVAANASDGLGAALPPALARLGIIAGLVMTVGVIGLAGVALRIDSAADMRWWLWLYGIGWLGTYVLYPAWCLLIARAG
ncbi:MAG: hypothetical protein ABIO99_10380 [Candidatus Limnocylindria bacterium]